MKEENFDLPCLQKIEFPVKKPVGRPSISANLPLQSINLNLLMISRHKLENFINELGELRNTQLPTEITSYFQYEKMSKQKMTPNKILRIVDQRIQKMVKNKKIKRNWSLSDIQVLIWATGKMFEKGMFELSELREQNSHWHSIADIIPGATSKNCMFKWLSLKKNRITNNNWSKQEERILSSIVKRVGVNKWKIASRDLYQLTKGGNKVFRHPKQCREHWRCFLDPSLRKGTWDVYEDKLLLEMILKNNGAKKWSKICRFFNGRTENSVKNRFRILYDRMKAFKSQEIDPDLNELDAIRNYLQVYLKRVSSTIQNRAEIVRRILAGTNEDSSQEMSEQSEVQFGEAQQHPENQYLIPFLQKTVMVKHEQAPQQPSILNVSPFSQEKKNSEGQDKTVTPPVLKTQNQHEENVNQIQDMVTYAGNIQYSAAQMMSYYYPSQQMGFADPYSCGFVYPYDPNYFGYYNQNA